MNLVDMVYYEHLISIIGKDSFHMIIELKYTNTNTYLIEGAKGRLLFDTGWAGTFPDFCRALGERKIPVQEIDYLMISHFHPDHMGIAEEIARQGVTIVIADVQRDFIHSSDHILIKDKHAGFLPIREEGLRIIAIEESRSFLQELGIDGEMIYTPGHSDDSISLWLDDGSLLVGDLNPLYELDMHRGTVIEDSWRKLLRRDPKVIYYGHAKTWRKNTEQDGDSGQGSAKTNLIMVDESGDDPADVKRTQNDPGYAVDYEERDLYLLVKRIMSYIDKNQSLDKISRKTGADRAFVEDVARMYLTHQNVGVQGILDRIEIKNK